jgi:hypothetical protein
MKNEKKKLSAKQLSVIEDLLAADMDQRQILKKHKLKPDVYRKWFDDELFSDELSWQLESARRQSELIIARFAPIAAAKLAALTESQKEETARRACLDIISLKLGIGKPDDEKPADETDDCAEIDPETCRKILSILAKEEK